MESWPRNCVPMAWSSIVRASPVSWCSASTAKAGPSCVSCFFFLKGKIGNQNCFCCFQLTETPAGNDQCPRLNGRFPIGDKCGIYNECEGGTARLVHCPESLVFDTIQAVCEFPDIANRTGCLAEDILGFRCPHGSNVDSDVVLQFGDHERIAKVWCIQKVCH